jgi:FkbM family methyltransferase
MPNIKIYDCVNFFNEVEILHLRLDYLYDVVDKFVIVESLDSHSKRYRKKEYIFIKNKHIYEPYMDKIIYLQIDNLPYDGDKGNKWLNENYQKNYCKKGIKKANSNDWIMYSDLDEIPSKDGIEFMKKNTLNISVKIVTFSQKLFYYYVNVLQKQIWGGTVAIRKTNFINMMNLRKLRTSKKYSIIENGGWHYTYQGGVDMIYQKMMSYAESIQNNKYIDKNNIYKSLESNSDLLGRNNNEFSKQTIDITQSKMAPDNIQKMIKLYPYIIKPYTEINITYICLIYKSTKWLQFVYDNFKKYTNLIGNEFYFIANDATPEVLDYLNKNNIPYYIHNNTFEQKKEWYINNVYRAWNNGIKIAKGKYIICINSDMTFTPKWSDKLLSVITNNTCVSSRLVERGILKSGKYGIERNFGNNYSDYNEKKFLKYAKKIQVNKLEPGGLYMPLLIKKKHIEQIGYYPEGNIIPGSDIYNPIYAKKGEKSISGDNIFIEKLKKINVNHVTDFGSIIYHFQEGEMRENIINNKSVRFTNDNNHIIILPKSLISNTFAKRNNHEVMFRKLITYLINNNIININANIIDSGAWIGDNSILWAKSINGIVYAIDPSNNNIDYIKQVSKLNNINNIQTIVTAISNENKKIFTDDDLYHAEFNTISGKTTVSAVTLDNLYETKQITNIGFIHLDVEGFEYKVLQGSVDIIDKYNPIICFEQHILTDNYNQIYDFLLKRNYTIYIINEKLLGCKPDCRNFISFPNNSEYSIQKINKHLKSNKLNYIKAVIDKPCLYLFENNNNLLL